MRSVFDVVIAAGASVSGAVDLGMEGNLGGVVLPAGWTTANVQLEGSMDAVNYYPMFTATGTVVGTTVGGGAVASTMYVLDPDTTIPARYVRVRSGTSAVPVVQAVQRTVTLIAGRFV